jgi:hypothetical protein
MKTLPQPESEVLNYIKEFDYKYGTALDAISSNAKMTSLVARDTELRNSDALGFKESVDTMDELSKKMDNLVQSRMESRFRQIIQARLTFADMPDRLERIPKAHEETFGWVYSPPEEHPEHGSWNDFGQWLRATGEERIYWITGQKTSASNKPALKHIQESRVLAKAH